MEFRFLLCATLFFCVAVPPLRSHDPITTKLTWTQEISRVVYKRCVSCHRPNGSAFSLQTYEEARPWAKAIRDQVRSRTMPPWGAVKGIGEFLNDPSLSDPEIDMLITWVEGGAPEGDPVYLPSLPPASSSDPVPALAFARKAEVLNLWRPSKSTLLVAIEPKASAASLEVWVSRKNSSVERLLWLKGQRPASVPQFVFRQPVAVVPGDTVHVTAPIALLCR